MDMVGHQMSFDNLHAFIRAELFYNVTYTYFVLIINCFSSILGSKDNVIFVSHASIFRNTKNSVVLNRLKPIKKITAA